MFGRGELTDRNRFFLFTQPKKTGSSRYYSFRGSRTLLVNVLDPKITSPDCTRPCGARKKNYWPLLFFFSRVERYFFVVLIELIFNKSWKINMILKRNEIILGAKNGRKNGQKAKSKTGGWRWCGGHLLRARCIWPWTCLCNRRAWKVYSIWSRRAAKVRIAGKI